MSYDKNTPFGLKSKIDYYTKRCEDKSLTDGQRTYASCWLDGIDQARYEIVKTGGMPSKKNAQALIELNKKNHGDVAYFTGYLAGQDFIPGKRK